MNEEQLVKQIKDIAIEASKIMLNREFSVDEKTGNCDLVTTNDIAVQKYLEPKLTELIEGSIFLGEEGDKTEHNAKYIWVVDPIDGTANYALDLELSVISIALLKNNEQYIGVVYNPYRKETFHAIKGHGAFVNNNEIHVSNKDFKDSMFCSAMCLYEKKYAKKCFNIIEKVYMESMDLRRLGSAALEMCYLACGRADIYFEARLSCWDYAAATLIVKEAGGYAEFMFNELMPLDRPCGIICANTKGNFEHLRNIVYEEITEELFK